MQKTNIIAAAILASGLSFGVINGIDINIGTDLTSHSILQPDLIITQHGLFGNTYNINLGNTLQDADTIQPVLTVLNTANHLDTVVFHIKGYGGDVDSLFALQNAMALSKAKIILSVEGNSSSAYAALATTPGYKLIMSKNAFLMFHMGSINGLDCNQQTGLFDGIPASKSCQNMKDAYVKEISQEILDNPYLTLQDKQTLLSGNEVYLTSEQVVQRQEDMS